MGKIKKTKIPTPKEGIVWPITPGGDNSTTFTCKMAFATSIRSLDSKAAEMIMKEKNWRFGYKPYIYSHVLLSSTKAENAIKIAEDGLEYLYSNFKFTRKGRSVSLSDALQLSNNQTFHTHTIHGQKPRRSTPKLKIPYQNKNLTGKNLLQQLKKWVRLGTIEPSVKISVENVIENSSKWLDFSGRYFVIMGAGAAMAPFSALLKLGANIIAIDLDKPHIWRRLLKMAQNSCGTITFPIRANYQKDISKLSVNDLAEVAGCNLLTEMPEVCNWLLKVFPNTKLTIGGYCYLDGKAHVQVALAMDFIMKNVVEKRPNTSIAFLCSPTDVFIVPEEAHKDSQYRYKTWSLNSLWQEPVKMLAQPRLLDRNSAGPSNLKDEFGSSLYFVNSIILAQGPNYILAKRMQQWRSILARAKGWKVSANVAPAALTHSVMSNSLLAAGYAGAYNFKPIEIFEPNTANTIMTALLIYDLHQKIEKREKYNPLDMFKENAVHGGVWRMAYRMGSLVEIAAILHFIEKYHLKPLTVAAVAGGIFAFLSKNSKL